MNVCTDVFTGVDASRVFAPPPPPSPQPVPPHQSQPSTNPATTSTYSFALRLALSWSPSGINFHFCAQTFLAATHLTLLYCTCDSLARLRMRWFARYCLLISTITCMFSPLRAAAVMCLVCECPVSSQYAAHERLPVHAALALLNSDENCPEK